MHGSAGVESENSRAWDHSWIAFKALERCYIGDLYDSAQDEEWLVREAKNNKGISQDDNWSMKERYSTSKTTNFYLFENERYKVKLDCKGVDWIGKHYVITDNGKGKSRVYTNCSMLSREVDSYRKTLI